MGKPGPLGKEGWGRLIGLRGEDRGGFRLPVLQIYVQDDFGSTYRLDPKQAPADGYQIYNEITVPQVRRN